MSLARIVMFILILLDEGSCDGYTDDRNIERGGEIVTNRDEIMSAFQKVSENTLIMTGKLYKEEYMEKMSEAAFTQAISRLCKNGDIERISKGIYCRPVKTRFGTVLPSDKSIADMFTGNRSGLIVGYGLYNSLGVTTQVSKRVTAYSSIVDERLKQIGNVTIHRYDIDYSEEAKATISLMELLLHYNDIQDINNNAFLKSIGQLAGKYSDSTFDEVQKAIRYPKWSIAFLREVLRFHNVPNRLNRYLSGLSNYRIPTMEDLYEIARQSE